MDGIPGHGSCSKCGLARIAGPDGPFCASCAVAGSVTTGRNNNHVPYPSKKQFEAVALVGSIGSKLTGKNINGEPLMQEVYQPVIVNARVDVPQPLIGNVYERCIAILQSVPAPRDIKSYKKLMKLIATLEELKAQ